jgi:hypothetical protein
MSKSNNQSWENGQIGIFTLLLIIFFIWAFAGGRPFFRDRGRDLRTTVRDAGHDLRSTGRDAAASIRDTVQ